MQHKHLPVNVIFELFDTLIKPILLYGSEIYGSSMSKDIKQVHVIFIKKTLGVKPSTNNCVIYVETGRYALQIDVHVRMIKYWLKLTLSHSHQYINKLFCESSEWLSYVQKLLCQNGFAYVWQSNGKCIDHTVFIRSFEQRIKDNFQQKCFSEINISNRCILYKAIDRRFEMAKYLLCVHINSNRKALCRLRLSSQIDYL